MYDTPEARDKSPTSSGPAGANTMYVNIGDTLKLVR